MWDVLKLASFKRWPNTLVLSDWAYAVSNLNYLCFGARLFARVKVNHRGVYSRILAEVCAIAMATGWLKT